MATIPCYKAECLSCGHKFVRGIRDEDARYWQDDFGTEKPKCEKCGSADITAKKTWD